MDNNDNNTKKPYPSTQSVTNNSQQSILAPSSDGNKPYEADPDDANRSSRSSYLITTDSAISLDRLVDPSVPSINIDHKSQKQQVTATSQIGGKGVYF